MKAFRILSFAVVITALFTSLCFAQGTRTWQQSQYEEFTRGAARGVAVHSDGWLELAPVLKTIATTPSTYLWAIASDGAGNVFAAAGSPARVYRITPQGQVAVIFEPRELQVQALVVDRQGVIYAATSPDGKVYKITRNAGTEQPPASGANPKTPVQSPQTSQPGANQQGTTPQPQAPQSATNEYSATVFLEPQTKYIWDLALDNDSRVYVATGDQGQIFRVERDGKSSVLFKSDEAHIRVLKFDGKGNLIAGSDGSGLIYRISPSGEAFVLYSAPKKEITALAISPEGDIYASGVGEKRSTGPNFPPMMIGPQPPPQPAGTQPQTAPVPPSIPLSSTGGSDVYRITPDGAPQRVWTTREDLIYALGFDARKRLLVGMGNKGRLIALEPNGEFVELQKLSATQITNFAPAPQGGTYAATSNLGKIFQIGPNTEPEGSFESEVFDAKLFSRWGRLDARGAGNFELSARSGNVDNPDRNWSGWNKIDFSKDATVQAPPARFVQWRAVLRPGNPAPRVDSVSVFYRAKNVAPVLDDVVAAPGAKFLSVPRTGAGSANPEGQLQITVGSAAREASGREQQTQSPPRGLESPMPANRDRGSVAVRWSVRDENEDDLLFDVYYRGDGENRWKLLRNDIRDRYFTWEAGLLPDGGYQIRVIASDSPSNSPGDALTDTRDSIRFEIDNTSPQISGLTGRLDEGQIQITFRAVDGFSTIKRAEYSVNGGEWKFVEPVGQISDARVENYDFTIPAPRVTTLVDSNEGKATPEEHLVVVRVFDRFDNVSATRVVVRAGAK